MKAILVARRVIFSFLIIGTLSIINSCGTLPNGRGWGEDATFSPGWGRVRRAAYDALVSPVTWGTAASAALLQIDGWDRKFSDWASDRTPIFGSRKSAGDWSDYLLYSSGALYGVTALASPSGDRAGPWTGNKMKGLIVGGAAFGISQGSVEVLKDLMKRERPNQSNNHSFPSGHAAAATAFATLASKNIESVQPARSTQVVSNVSLGLMAGGVAWARVEARKHYPSDVLAGIAIGHFLSAFINDAFLGIDEKRRGLVPNAEISRHGFFLGLTWNFAE